MDVIDWRVAQRIGERVAGSPPSGGVRAASVQPRAHEFARRVSDYSGLPQPVELPELEAVDRGAWIAANLRTMRPLLGGLSERIGAGTGPLAVPLRTASGFLIGAQLGALTGVLSQRVLGQYDLALLGEPAPPRLLLLAPNLAIAAREQSVDLEELVLWVSIHEITHAVQFGGAPWLREHLGGMLKELIDGLEVTLLGGDGEAAGDGNKTAGGGEAGSERAGDGTGDGDGGKTAGGGEAAGGGAASGAGKKGSTSGARGNGAFSAGRFSLPNLPNVPDPAELRKLVERARSGELLRMTLGEDRWALVERMQTAMSLVEGHAEHTMDAVGGEVLPSLPKLRSAMTRRRDRSKIGQRGLPWRVLERLLGLEMKLRQYEVGRRFCDGVVAVGGPEALAAVWTGPEQLPSAEELADPRAWLRRTGGNPARTGRTHVPPVTS